MASEWIKCTKRDGQVLYVNIERALTVAPTSGGAQIAFSGPDDEVVQVRETPDQVMALWRAVRDAARS